MQTPRSTFECAYCGLLKPATDEHVPPASLYLSPRPLAAPTVKACSDCNGGGSADDEYFRDCVLSYHRVADQVRVQPLVEKMVRAARLPAKRRYAEARLSAFRNVQVKTHSGLLVGTAPAIAIDRARMIRIVERYLRGLYRFEVGARVPDDYSVVASVDPERTLQLLDHAMPWFTSAERHIVQDNVFEYMWTRATDRPDTSVWLLVFYGQFPILGFIRPSSPLPADTEG